MPDDPNYFKLSVWRQGEVRATYIPWGSPLLEPLGFPLLYPTGQSGWRIGLPGTSGEKITPHKYARWLLMSDPRFNLFGRLSQAWQLEMPYGD